MGTAVDEDADVVVTCEPSCDASFARPRAAADVRFFFRDVIGSADGAGAVALLDVVTDVLVCGGDGASGGGGSGAVIGHLIVVDGSGSTSLRPATCSAIANAHTSAVV